IARCIIRCLKSASLSPKDIGAVCLHGTATVNNDLAEANAVRAVFGSYDVPCFGIKPQFGHLLGSSALVEVVICSDAVRRRIIPSSLLYGSPDPLCSLNLSAETGELKSPYILSLNFGFGGHIAAVIIGKI
ncbi:MAG: beta-ketoacyl-[acyl-carrier-protein] synthase II, partial [Fibrobacteres bacterium]|nr:beta-ketoacyl-[acyl-carrier-protein] synthase II [Fibrobacterota bacterium]